MLPPITDTLKEVESNRACKSLQNIRKQPIAQKYTASKPLSETPRDTETPETSSLGYPNLEAPTRVSPGTTTMLKTHAKSRIAI